MHSANEVSFTSRAPLVKFTGRTDKVIGAITGNPNDLSHAKGEFKVDLTSLDTGIGLRNEHMKNFLEASKYPFAVLKIKSVKGPRRLKPNQPANVTILGDMSLHGQTRTVSFPAEVTYLPEQNAQFRAGNWIQVSSEFKLKMTDYGVQLPSMILGPKVSDQVTIAIDTSVRQKGSGRAAQRNPCNPCAPAAKKPVNPCSPANPCAMKK